MEWEILMTAQVEAFLDDLYDTDRLSHQLVNQAILVLERNGPAEGRPLVDTVTSSRIANMKELRPPSAGRSEVRILFVFDPWRSRCCWWPATSPGSGSGGTRRRFRRLSRNMRITWERGRRRWGCERGIAVAGVGEPGARGRDRRGTRGVRSGGVGDAG